MGTMLLPIAMLSGSIGSVLAAGTSIVDDGGSNDPNGDGQNDLTRLTNDDPATTAFEVAWSWDEPTTIKGGNTSNACAMFDTDGDGNVNYSFCVEVSDPNSDGNYVITDSGSGTDSVADFPAWIECSDAKNDRCTQPTRLADPYTSPAVAATCTITEANTDPFGPTGTTAGTPGGAGDDYPADLTATCTIDASLIPTAAQFVNVCSYPSAGNDGNNNPFDCVITPGAGFLKIVKNAGNDTTTGFTFNASAASLVGASSWTITGSGSVQLITYMPTSTLDLSEAVPAGWKLDSAACVISAASAVSTGTGSATGVTDLEIRAGLETVCTFVDSPDTSDERAAVSIDKRTNGASDLGSVAAGSAITWTYLVTNTGTVTLTNVTVTDDKVSAAAIDCDGGANTPTDNVVASLAAGVSVTCTATGVAQVGAYANTGTATGTPPQGGNVSATDNSSYTGVRETTPPPPPPSPPSLTVDKAYAGNTGGTASNGTGIAKVGDVLTYTVAYTVVNPSVTGGVIKDVLPAGVAYVAGSATGNTWFSFSGYDAGTRTLTWSAPVVGASGSVGYRVTVLDGAFNLPQPLVNTATVDSDQTTPDDDTASVLVQAIQAAVGFPTATLPPTDVVGGGSGEPAGPGFGLLLALLAIAGVGLGAGRLVSSPDRHRRQEARRR